MAVIEEIVDKLATIEAILKNQDARIANLEERLLYYKRKLEELMSQRL